MTTIEKAIATYGVDMQLTVAVEEFSELIKEICKCKRGNDNIDGITEEMADCYIMLKQLEIIFDIDTRDIRHIINNKIDRLKCRLEEVAERREGVEESPVDSSTPSVTDSKGDRNG
jgi:NTP pyrophosphatase (non-canonical NTP hydrolase)